MRSAAAAVTRRGARGFSQTAALRIAVIDISGVKEEIIERSDMPLGKVQQVLKDETQAVLGYGPQGRGQSLNLRDNGVKVIVGVRKGKSMDAALADGWVEGKDLFTIEEAAE